MVWQVSEFLSFLQLDNISKTFFKGLFVLFLVVSSMLRAGFQLWRAGLLLLPCDRFSSGFL